MKVNFTKMQAEEIAHKLCIVCDEPDLQDSYGVTEEQVAAAADAFLAARKGGVVEFDDDIAEVIAGELENSIHIYRDRAKNEMSRMDFRVPLIRAHIGSLRRAIKKVRPA